MLSYILFDNYTYHLTDYGDLYTLKFVTTVNSAM
jgi:hypothetical protein